MGDEEIDGRPLFMGRGSSLGGSASSFCSSTFANVPAFARFAPDLLVCSSLFISSLIRRFFAFKISLNFAHLTL